MTVTDPRLKPFVDADTITWHRHTVFRPHRGDDGNLYTLGAKVEDSYSIPLDTYLPEVVEAKADSQYPLGQPLTDEGVGVAVVDPVTLDDVHDAVREWCRVNLGRDDVQFDN